MLKSVRQVAGFEWDETAMREAAGRNLLSIIHAAVRNPRPKESAADFGARLHAVWRAPPQLTVGNPRELSNLIATTG